MSEQPSYSTNVDFAPRHPQAVETEHTRTPVDAGASAVGTRAPAVETSELRAAELTAAVYGATIRFDDDRKIWLVYDDGYWRENAHGDVAARVKLIAADSENRLRDAGYPAREAENAAKALQSSRGVAAVMTLLSNEPGIRVRTIDLDADRFALNIANGTIDLRTGSLHPHCPADLITRKLSVAFDPDARCPLWMGFLNTTFAERRDLIDYVQRVIGFCASGDISVQEFYVMYGAGANGKSVLVDTVCRILGPYAGIAPESLLTVHKRGNEHPTEIADLQGKRLVVASETDASGVLRLPLIKRMTGDEVMKARRMRTDFYEFQRTHKIIMVTNHRPRVPEDTEAAWRRIRLIPFDVTVPAERRDTDLLRKLRNEAAGILAWIVRGSIDRLRNGMAPPPCVLAATESYRAETDSFGDFIAAALTVTPGLRVTRKDMAEAYASWSVNAGEPEPLKGMALYERVRAVPGVAEAKPWKLGGTTVRGFEGVGLRWQNGCADATVCHAS